MKKAYSLFARPVSDREFWGDALSYNRCRFATRLPTDRIYTPSHYWLREVEPGLWRVGLTAYEQGWLYQVRGQPEPSSVDARAYAGVLNAAIDARLEGRELDDGDE